MNVINMLDDYRLLAENARELGNFPAYQAYTRKYPALFENVLKYLYMADLNVIRPMVEQTDFEALLQIGEENVAAGQTEDIVTRTRATADGLGFNDEIDLYLGLELGNIGGCSLRAERPFLYIGIDRPLNAEVLRYFLPHEFNHMVRIAALPEVDGFDFRERTLTEGLGSYAPIAHYGLPYGPETISATLSLPRETVRTLLDRSEDVHNSVTAHFGEPLSPELMGAYFNMGSADAERVTLGGYFAGMQIIHRLVEAGLDFKALTEMPGDKIWQVYQALD